MMRKYGFIGLTLLLSCVFLLGFAQNSQVDRKQLRDMLTQLGYEVNDVVKDAGKEKYSVKFTNNGLDIPVGYEISPSNSYIWLTANLGEAPTDSAKFLGLLKENAKIQPSFFYITSSGRLMAALPIENRGVTNVILRQRSETFSENVGKTKEIWLK
jgi:hypothetical protein